MSNILVLCTGNSCRSQMAQGFLQHHAAIQKKDLSIFSAGIEAHGVNPRAIQVMLEVGINISSHVSQTVHDLPQIEFAFVITVCDNARESCPVFPAATQKVHKSFADPAKAVGTEEEIMTQFRLVRDEIEEFSRNFIRDLQP